MTAQRHAPGQIGDAADRSGYENRQMAWERVVNFIKGLGYKAEMMMGMMAPTIPFALMAGLGEMGRMNRLISPIYGGAIRRKPEWHQLSRGCLMSDTTKDTRANDGNPSAK